MGIDISTTATKAILIDTKGSLIASASSEYSYNTPRPLWTEQDPNLWWKATIESVRSVLIRSNINAEDIKAIGLTGQMHGLVLLDDKGEVLRPAILWNDQRTAKECDEIRKRLGKELLIKITGNDALTGFTAPKILWVRNNEPHIFDKIRHILLPKDYVRYKLTGNNATDKAGGSGTLLFDLKERDWSKIILDTLEINPSWLAPTFEGTQITGYVNREAAEITGLKEGIPIVAGGGDQAAQAVGVGAVKEGIIAITLGTSGVVFASTDKPFIDPQGRVHSFCHAVPSKWHLMGVMLSAGGSLRFIRDILSSEEDFDRFLSPANEVPPGCEGLLYLPYLTGERTPHADPYARGAFVGLTVRHSKAHIIRSVLEGVAFGLKDNFELVKKIGPSNITEVRISGGGAKSKLWRQIIADVLGMELETVNTTEGAAYGAAILSACGIGAFPDVESACRTIIKVKDIVLPSTNCKLYAGLYEIYKDLYPALKPIFNTITAKAP